MIWNEWFIFIFIDIYSNYNNFKYIFFTVSKFYKNLVKWVLTEILYSVAGTTTLDREWHIYTRSSKLNKTGSSNKIVTYFLSIADSFSPIFSCTPNYLTSISTCWRLTYIKHMCLVHVVWDFPEEWFVVLWLVFWAPLFLWFCTIGWWFSRPLFADFFHHWLVI